MSAPGGKADMIFGFETKRRYRTLGTVGSGSQLVVGVLRSVNRECCNRVACNNWGGPIFCLPLWRRDTQHSGPGLTTPTA